MLMSLLISITTISSVQADSGFSDVPMSHKYYKAIKLIHERGIVQGYEDGTYKPNQVLTRAELLKIIMESSFEGADFEPYMDDNCFDDVRGGDWFVKYICFAKVRNMVSGYPGTNEFRPNNPVNFVEALKITFKGFDEYKQIESDPVIWFKSYVDMASLKNFIPLDIKAFDQMFTRGQMADMIARIITHLEGTQDEYLGDKKDMRMTFEGIEKGGVLEMKEKEDMMDKEEDMMMDKEEDMMDGEEMMDKEKDMMDGEEMMDEEKDMMVDVEGCIEAGQSLGPWAAGNNSVCCSGLSEVVTETVNGIVRTCEMFEIAMCVAEGMSLGRYVEGNNAMCCEGLVEELTDEFGNVIEYSGDRGVCSTPQVEVGLDFGAFQPELVDVDVVAAECVEKGGDLGARVEGNESWCCEGLVAVGADANSRGMCKELEMAQCIGVGGDLGPDVPQNQAQCCNGTVPYMEEGSDMRTCEEPAEEE